MISSRRDIAFTNRQQQVQAKLKRKQTDVDYLDQPCTSREEDQLVLLKRLRCNSSNLSPVCDISEDSSKSSHDPEYSDCQTTSTGGKTYAKTRTFSVTEESCILADRRLTSIRQQSDQLLSVVGSEKIAASPSTIFRKREQCRLKALRRCEADLNKADALQLCYDGKIINEIDRYVYIGQYYDPDQHFSERIMAVKSFPAGVSVTAQTVFNAIVNEVCGPCISNVFSIMADTTSLNNGKKSGVNKRLVDFFNENVGHDIHVLECMFHVNEIYFLHVIAIIEGKTKGPGAMQDGALLNCIKSINKPDINNILPRHSIPVPITNIASLQLKAKVQWFSEQKAKGFQDGSFRNDYLCLLVLASYLVMDVPDNLKYLLEYRQEEISHSRWITTASGYLRLLIFGLGNFGVDPKKKLFKIASYIVCVYVPSFMLIHLKPTASEGPFLTLFQRDILLAYRDLDPEIADVALKYFLKHATCCLNPKNVPLSVYGKTPLYSVEAVKVCILPDTVDIKSHLMDRTTRLKHFFTTQSKISSMYFV